MVKRKIRFFKKRKKNSNCLGIKSPSGWKCHAEVAGSVTSKTTVPQPNQIYLTRSSMCFFQVPMSRSYKIFIHMIFYAQHVSFYMWQTIINILR